MSAMKAPVLAALAPGVFVAGRIVSAISSRNAMSLAVNSPSVASSRGKLARSLAASKPLPPTNETAPNKALTRRINSRRLTSRSDSVSDDVFIFGSQVAAIELVHGEVRRAGGDRHVGERRVLAGSGGHACAVGYENVPRIPHLIVRVEHRRFWIVPH